MTCEYFNCQETGSDFDLSIGTVSDDEAPTPKPGLRCRLVLCPTHEALITSADGIAVWLAPPEEA